ncbi:UNVERIFIED_CONTAM: hypothetical protein Sindi_2491900, partial [Sesamum indicum]
LFATSSEGLRRGAGLSYGQRPVFPPSCSTYGIQHQGPRWRRDDIAETCYRFGGSGRIANCPNQTIDVVGSVASGTQSQNSDRSSGRGVERGRGRGRVTGNRDSGHTIGSSRRGVGAQ